jgi:hypothetical protein
MIAIEPTLHNMIDYPVKYDSYRANATQHDRLSCQV